MHPSLDHYSVRVRLLGFGTSSFDVEVFAYVYARDWEQFLEVQEGLLLSIMRIVEQTGTQIALPSQVIYVASHSARDRSTLSEMLQQSGSQHNLPSRDAVAAPE
jgi:MscS family membrane protein